ncbi:hypothetical protein LTS18_005803 [Coniosporium uncinatum]|uniref:Uncharacterized protein n=1 Tax=Coniosporium uncinatum TaxID=93489 RepID=A0ACC3DB81_9PEZI|nr:hypothetical protein LTS18_005803 [Coniosporium uncinatum]
MAAAQVFKAQGYQQIARDIFFHEAAEVDGFSYGSSPNLVIVSAWMGAAPKHIAKYSSTYTKRYPSSQIIVIANSMADVFITSSAAHHRRLRPVIEVIQACVKMNDKPRILLHVFSNGGSMTACHLAIAYRSQLSLPLPITAMALDSCPGLPEYWTGLRAVSTGLPKSFLPRLLGLLVIHLALITFAVVDNLIVSESFFTWLRRNLNDESLFAKEVPRCYLYSKEDDMVLWRDIEAHAADAVAEGYDVEKVRFEGSKHVGHMVVDSKRYWSAIERALKDV